MAGGWGRNTIPTYELDKVGCRRSEYHSDLRTRQSWAPWVGIPFRLTNSTKLGAVGRNTIPTYELDKAGCRRSEYHSDLRTRQSWVPWVGIPLVCCGRGHKRPTTIGFLRPCRSRGRRVPNLWVQCARYGTQQIGAIRSLRPPRSNDRRVPHLVKARTVVWTLESVFASAGVP